MCAFRGRGRTLCTLPLCCALGSDAKEVESTLCVSNTFMNLCEFKEIADDVSVTSGSKTFVRQDVPMPNPRRLVPCNPNVKQLTVSNKFRPVGAMSISLCVGIGDIYIAGTAASWEPVSMLLFHFSLCGCHGVLHSHAAQH